jgi:hypothetical protein
MKNKVLAAIHKTGQTTVNVRANRPMDKKSLHCFINVAVRGRIPLAPRRSSPRRAKDARTPEDLDDGNAW